MDSFSAFPEKASTSYTHFDPAFGGDEDLLPCALVLLEESSDQALVMPRPVDCSRIPESAA